MDVKQEIEVSLDDDTPSIDTAETLVEEVLLREEDPVTEKLMVQKKTDEIYLDALRDRAENLQHLATTAQAKADAAATTYRLEKNRLEHCQRRVVEKIKRENRAEPSPPSTIVSSPDRLPPNILWVLDHKMPAQKFPPCLLPRTAVCTLDMGPYGAYIVSGIGRFIEISKAQDDQALPPHVSRQNLVKIFDAGGEVRQILALGEKTDPTLIVVSRCMKIVVLRKLQLLIGNLGGSHPVIPCTEVLDWVPDLKNFYPPPVNARFEVAGGQLLLNGPTIFRLRNFLDVSPDLVLTVAEQLPNNPKASKRSVACSEYPAFAYYLEGRQNLVYWPPHEFTPRIFPWSPPKNASIDGWDMMLCKDQLFLATTETLVYINVKNGNVCETKIYDAEGDYRIPNRHLSCGSPNDVFTRSEWNDGLHNV